MKKTDVQRCIVCGKKMFHMFGYQGFEYFRCGSCGHVSTLPLPTKQQMKEYYQQKFLTGNYKLLRTYAEKYKKIYASFVEMLRNELSSRDETFKGKAVLDVGCFTGEFLELMRDEGCDVYGLELQEEAVKIANKKLKGRVRAADVMSDAFPKKKFDIIALLGIVEHVTDPMKLLRRCFQLLKKDGIVIVQTPNSGSILATLSKQYWPPFAPVEHIHLFSAVSLRKALEEQGGESVRIHGHWKRLPILYVYNQFQNFGPEFYRLFKPLEKFIKKFGDVSLPFYAGEMIAIARKK